MGYLRLCSLSYYKKDFIGAIKCGLYACLIDRNTDNKIEYLTIFDEEGGVDVLIKTFGEKKENVNYYDRIGAYAIIIENNKLATVKTSKGNFLIGGKIEDNESKEDCIKRECLEETGYQVEVSDFICKADSYELHDKIGYFHPVGYFYWVKLIEKVKDPEENDHLLEWVKLDEVAKKLFLKHQLWAVNQAINIKNKE